MDTRRYVVKWGRGLSQIDADVSRLPQAFNAFLVLCALHPRFNQHILLMQALAPLVRLRRKVRFDNTQVRAIMKFVKVIIHYYRKVNALQGISMKIWLGN